jgi:ubiquinone/menaquinone biosynthesis C-methylase UbiE
MTSVAIMGCKRNDCGMIPAPNNTTAQCSSCGRNIIYDGGIFVDSFSPSLPSFLEEIPYDEMHGVSTSNSKGLGVGYINLITRTTNVSIDHKTTILEVGSGTGLLSLGLYMSGLADNLVITDVSKVFLKANRESITRYAHSQNRIMTLDSPTHVLCSIDDLPFKGEAFELILGNSVLHHIYDYRNALISMGKNLKQGGCIVMSEPMVQGKALQALILNLIAQIDRRAAHPVLTAHDYKQIDNIVTASNKAWWNAQAEKKRDTADDKHLFDADEIKKVGHELGFSEIYVVDVGSVPDNLNRNVESAARMCGINIDRIREYGYVNEVVLETIVETMRESFFCNHALLIFQK